MQTIDDINRSRGGALGPSPGFISVTFIDRRDRLGVPLGVPWCTWRARAHIPLQRRYVSLQTSHVLLEELHDIANLGRGVVAEALAPHELLESPDLTQVFKNTT